jgi:hypothetical protein
MRGTGKFGLCLGIAASMWLGCGDDDDDEVPEDAAVDARVTCEITAGILDDSGTRAFPVGMGGEGDLRVSTDVLTAVFAHIERPAIIAASGGTLIDLYLNGRDDHLNEYSQLAGASQPLQVRYTDVEVVEQDDHHVVVESRGFVSPQPPREGQDPAVTPHPGEDLTYVTRWELRCGDPRVHLHSSLTNDGDQPYVSNAGWGIMDVMMWGTRSLIPFCPVQGQGDRCNPFDIENPAAGLIFSSYVGATGSLVGQPGTFAFYIDDPISERFIGVHDPQVSAFGFPQLGTTNLAPGQHLELRRAIVVGDRADVASAADIALEALEARGVVETGWVTGRLVPPGGGGFSSNPYDRPLVVLATPADTGDPTDPDAWTPRTTVRVEEDGSFAARMPVGGVAYEVRMMGREPFSDEGGAVGAGETLELGDITLPPLPELRVSVTDPDDGAVPARIVIVGKNGTADPDFGPDQGGSPVDNIALTDGNGDVALPLAEGTYDVYATHGPFWTVAIAEDVAVGNGGADVALTLQPLDVVPEGFISADFHVHSAASFDSSLPITDRVRAFLAEGVDAIVATEHDIIFDYTPALAVVEEDLPPTWRGRLKTFVGVESTASIPFPEFPTTIGHHNGFPLVLQEGAHKNGAPMDEFIDVGTLYERILGVPSPVANPIVQFNHPRASRSGSVWLGYFDSCEFDPTAPIDFDGPCFGTAGPGGTRPYDFDAMEVMNGKSLRSFVNMTRDWYGLMRQAPYDEWRAVGTANADSHRLVIDQAGYPVNLLRTPVALDDLDDDVLVDTLRSGAVAGSLGVFLWFEARSVEPDGPVSEPGDMLSTTGDVVLDITVRAAPWVPVDELRILVNGEVVDRVDLSEFTPVDPFGTDGVERYAGTVPLPSLASDAFVTLEAGFVMPDVGDIPRDDFGMLVPDPGPSPMPFGAVVPHGHPMAITNPVFIDADGDGSYTPPGEPLPELPE